MNNKFTLKEAALAFIIAIVCALSTSFIFLAVISAVADSSGQTVEVVSSTNWATYLNLFLSEAVFLVAFFLVKRALLFR